MLEQCGSTDANLIVVRQAFDSVTFYRTRSYKLSVGQGTFCEVRLRLT